MVKEETASSQVYYTKGILFKLRQFRRVAKTIWKSNREDQKTNDRLPAFK
jgi:hypothetical protein